jgi:hypothetical protein
MNKRLEQLKNQLNDLDTNFSSRLLSAVQYAVAAGQQTLTRFQDDQLEVIKKADQSPVTMADTEAEVLLRKCIAADFPEDAILSGDCAGGLPSTLVRLSPSAEIAQGLPSVTIMREGILPSSRVIEWSMN